MIKWALLWRRRPSIPLDLLKSTPRSLRSDLGVVLFRSQYSVHCLSVLVDNDLIIESIVILGRYTLSSSPENDERVWSQKRLDQMRAVHGQLALFEDNSWRETFQVIPKLPYSFSYRFQDSNGRKSELQVLDWETCALFWNCLKSENWNEQAALDKVREKYFDTFLKTDLHFILGTTLQFHQVAPNPWVIVGVYPIPHDSQDLLF